MQTSRLKSCSVNPFLRLYVSLIDYFLKNVIPTEEDVSSYRMALRKKEAAGIRKRKKHIVLHRELALEEAMDLL